MKNIKTICDMRNKKRIFASAKLFMPGLVVAIVSGSVMAQSAGDTNSGPALTQAGSVFPVDIGQGTNEVLCRIVQVLGEKGWGEGKLRVFFDNKVKCMVATDNVGKVRYFNGRYLEIVVSPHQIEIYEARPVHTNDFTEGAAVDFAKIDYANYYQRKSLIKRIDLSPLVQVDPTDVSPWFPQVDSVQSSDDYLTITFEVRNKKAKVVLDSHLELVPEKQ